jgi:hypothetical protein
MQRSEVISRWLYQLDVIILSLKCFLYKKKTDISAVEFKQKISILGKQFQVWIKKDKCSIMLS